MLKNIKESEIVEEIWYEVCFDDGRNNGFGFPCDENGVPEEDMNPAAKENYEYCLKHPEKFARFNKVVKREQTWRNPAEGTCECGETVYLINEYMGACQCPKCGQWYSLSGQELMPPERWGWDGTPIEEDW